jgi:hypothetical protein
MISEIHIPMWLACAGETMGQSCHSSATNSQSIQQVSSLMGEMLDVGMKIPTGVTALVGELFPGL